MVPLTGRRQQGHPHLSTQPGKHDREDKYTQGGAREEDSVPHSVWYSSMHSNHEFYYVCKLFVQHNTSRHPLMWYSMGRGHPERLDAGLVGCQTFHLCSWDVKQTFALFTRIINLKPLQRQEKSAQRDMHMTVGGEEPLKTRGLSGKVACPCECGERGASITPTTVVNFHILATIIYRHSDVNSRLTRRLGSSTVESI